jgi:hypothetical protein
MSPKEFQQDIKDKALVRQKLACAHCGVRLEPPIFPHYKKPAELGGNTSLHNCVILCQKLPSRIRPSWQLGKFG